MKYYPAFLDLKDKKAVVVGGGRVAERKARTLIKAGASVTVISPSIIEGLKILKDKGRLDHIKRKYKEGDLKDAFIVIAGTSSKETNIRVARDAGHLINVIDSPDEGNFIVPALVERGPLTMAVSTGGASPAVSRAIRKEIETQYDREFARYLRFVESVRKRAMKEIRDKGKREKFLRSMASEEVFSALRTTGFSAVSEKILSYLDNIR